VVTYLGRLAAHMGVLVALQAYLQLTERADTSLLCIGGGPLADELRRHDGVVVLDETSHADVHRFLPLSDLLLLPSVTTRRWREQFGRAAIEAMACGLPVVGSDSGEIPVLLEATGGGIVVPEGDAEALGEAIRSLLANEAARREMGMRGRREVTANFSTWAVARRLSGVFQGALSPC
jgi:glycosyltransferase involved in cell wall biosynthesis